MAQPLSTSNVNAPNADNLSTLYLDKLINDKHSLVLNVEKQRHLNVVSSASLSSYINQNNLHNIAPQKYVFVGQAMNVALLNDIIQQYFTDIQHVVISKHYLHDEFSRQALEVHLYAHQTQGTDLLAPNTLLDLAKAYFIDVFRVSKVCLSTPGLLVMDMDSTIIDMECIDEIAALVGVGEKVSELTERAMQGELDFNQSLQARVSCLKGVEVAQLESLKTRLPINPGFAKTMRVLQANGWITCIASGGFTYFANYLQSSFELDYAISNTLLIKDGLLMGEVVGDIINGEMKKQVLIDKLEHHNITAQQSICIGDGANDLLMMAEAALGVAYKAKPKVQIAADANIHYCGFEGLLYCLQA